MRRVLLPLLFIAAVVLGAFTLGYPLPMSRGWEAGAVYAICAVSVVPLYFLGRMLDSRAWVNHMLKREAKEMLKAEKAFARQQSAAAAKAEAEAAKAIDTLKDGPSTASQGNGYADDFLTKGAAEARC